MRIMAGVAYVEGFRPVARYYRSSTAPCETCRRDMYDWCDCEDNDQVNYIQIVVYVDTSTTKPSEGIYKVRIVDGYISYDQIKERTDFELLPGRRDFTEFSVYDSMDTSEDIPYSRHFIVSDIKYNERCKLVFNEFIPDVDRFKMQKYCLAFEKIIKTRLHPIESGSKNTTVSRREKKRY